jgi:hypothetical protein
MVPMTDGEFNTIAGSNRGGGARSSRLAVMACDAMRAKGVRVFTVGFKFSEARAMQTLKDCAADPPAQLLRGHER